MLLIGPHIASNQAQKLTSFLLTLTKPMQAKPTTTVNEGGNHERVVRLGKQREWPRVSGKGLVQEW